LWIFKFHPSDQHKDERAKFIEHCFSERGLNNYDLISANQAALNIYDCIEEVDSVVSSFSSSLLEAMMLQKIPVIIHPEGVIHYQNEIDSGSMLLKSNRRDFVDYFNMPRKTDLAISDRSDSENLEKIIDQIFTPKAK
jgi:CDP-glycerol glycerophosphotransferase (TagB/SpsB family)